MYIPRCRGGEEWDFVLVVVGRMREQRILTTFLVVRGGRYNKWYNPQPKSLSFFFAAAAGSVRDTSRFGKTLA